MNNAQLLSGSCILAFQIDAYYDDPNEELVGQAIVEDVGLGDAAETSAQRNVERKIQVVFGRRAAGLYLEGIRAERLKPLGVRPEEAPRQTVLIAAEMAVPVDQKLVLCVSADRGSRQQAGIQITRIV